MNNSTKPVASMDAEMTQFAADVLESIRQAKRGEFANIHSPEVIKARRRGRPVGTSKLDTKIQTAIRFDPDVLAALKATGRGWQTRVNDAMREWVLAHPVA